MDSHALAVWAISTDTLVGDSSVVLISQGWHREMYGQIAKSKVPDIFDRIE